MQEKVDGNGWKWFRPLMILCTGIFIFSVAAAAVYPFRSRDLQLSFVGKDRNYSVFLTKDEISAGACSRIMLHGADKNDTIKKVRIYGNNKSMRLWEADAVNFYYELSDKEGVALVEKGICFEKEDLELQMGDNFVKRFKALSASYLQERIIYAGICGCVFLLLVILLIMINNQKSENGIWDNYSTLAEFRKFGGDMKKYSQYMVYAAKTDLRAEVANSYLNRLWWLLEPFFSMLVYVIVFGKIMGRSIENYAVFVFSALLIWQFFCKTLNYSVKLVRNNRDIVTKVYVPKFILLLSNMMLNFYKMLFSLTVLIPMLFMFHVKIGLQIFWIVPAFATVILFSFGVGMVLLHYGVYIDDMAYAVGILLNMMMFLSGIFYDVMTGLPQPLNILMVCLNPIAMSIDTLRNALLYNTAANLPLLGIWLVASLLLCCMGVHLVYRNENSYVKVV